MKTQFWKLFAAAIVLALAALACANLPNGGSNLPDEETEVPSEETPAATDPASTDGPAGDSPDVLRVAYADGGDLWVWTEGVGNNQVYTGDKVTDVLFSDDGSLVVFMTFGSDSLFSGIWTVHTDSSNLRRLVTGAEIDALAQSDDDLRTVPYHWQFVPGTHTLAFNTQLHGRPGLTILDDLRLLNADTGELSTLFDVDQGGMFYYSPDGSQIAVIKPGEIDLVNADGSNRREDVLVHPGVNTSAGYQFYAIPSWHADGDHLRVVIPSAEPLGDDSSMSVWTIPTDGSPAVMVHEFSAMAPAGLFTNLFTNGELLGPDLDRLAFTIRVGEPADNTLELRTANIDGTDMSILASGKNQFQSWNPTGDWLAFKEEGDLFVVNATGGAVQSLAVGQQVIEMAWIDSGRFLYFSGSNADFDLRIGSIDAPSFSIGNGSSDSSVFDISN